MNACASARTLEPRTSPWLRCILNSSFFFLPHPIPLFLVILVSLIAPFVLKPKKRCLLIATLSSPQFTEQQIAAQTVIPAQNVIR
jgi:hypothetical protein